MKHIPSQRPKEAKSTPLLDSLIANTDIPATGGNWNDLALRQEDRIAEIIRDTSNTAMEVHQAVKQAGTANPEYDQLSLGFMRDLDEFSRQHVVLVNRRAGRTGQTRDNNDYTDYITIGVESQQLIETMSAVLPLGIAGLQEHHQNAIEVLEARNPRAVTDVEVKEPSTAQPAANA